VGRANVLDPPSIVVRQNRIRDDRQLHLAAPMAETGMLFTELV
jgi:hypothetical protein